MDIKKEMESLLYNFWITKEDNPDLYYKIKSSQNRLKDFIIKNLGSNLIIHEKFIKLEKIPTLVKANNGIESFTSTLDYVILLLVLIFLEDKAKGDRFILSDLIEYIKMSITYSLLETGIIQMYHLFEQLFLFSFKDVC